MCSSRSYVVPCMIQYELLTHRLQRFWRCVPSLLPAPRPSDVPLLALRVSHSRVRTCRNEKRNSKEHDDRENSRIPAQAAAGQPLATSHFSVRVFYQCASTAQCYIHLVLLTRSTQHCNATAINVSMPIFINVHYSAT